MLAALIEVLQQAGHRPARLRIQYTQHLQRSAYVSCPQGGTIEILNLKDWKLEEPIRLTSEAARLDPNLAGAHYNLGRFFFEIGKYDDASRELETARPSPARFC
jgi:hypothetical protein